MIIQQIFKAGNSSVVAIPKDYLDKLGFKDKDQVTLELLPDHEAIIIKKPSQKPKSSEREFQKWLANFLKEDGKLLDKLA